MCESRPQASDGATIEPLTFVKHTKRGDKSYTAPSLALPLADTHAHLTCFWSKDPVQVLERAACAGVHRLVTLYDPVGDDMDLPAYQELLRSWLDQARAAGCALADNVRFLAGVHPYGAPDYTDAVHEVLERALDDPLCAGVGEIGLDYHFDADDDIKAAPHDVQMDAMARQLALACERNVPVELHLRNDAGDALREAHADAYRVLREVGVPEAGCILHCFGEDAPTMERFAELGCYIAFGGAATFKRNEFVREAFAVCPLDRILFETDCPYMAPEPIRGLECEPAMITFTADALSRDRAERTGEAPDDILRAAYDNALRIFF